MTFFAGGTSSGSGLSLRVTWLTAANVTVGQAHAACSASNVCAVPDTALNSPELWSPRSPTLYTAVLQLTDSSGILLDSTSVTGANSYRFSLRFD